MLKLSGETITRGHNKKLAKAGCKHDLRKYSFTNRVVEAWNLLPQQVVAAKNVLQFEIGLDKVWADQEVRYNYLAELVCRTGSHARMQQNDTKEDADKVVDDQRP